jgi:hypothetical protein
MQAALRSNLRVLLNNDKFPKRCALAIASFIKEGMFVPNPDSKNDKVLIELSRTIRNECEIVKEWTSLERPELTQPFTSQFWSSSTGLLREETLVPDPEKQCRELKSGSKSMKPFCWSDDRVVALQTLYEFLIYFKYKRGHNNFVSWDWYRFPHVPILVRCKCKNIESSSFEYANSLKLKDKFYSSAWSEFLGGEPWAFGHGLHMLEDGRWKRMQPSDKFITIPSEEEKKDHKVTFLQLRRWVGRAAAVGISNAQRLLHYMAYYGTFGMGCDSLKAWEVDPRFQSAEYRISILKKCVQRWSNNTNAAQNLWFLAYYNRWGGSNGEGASLSPSQRCDLLCFLMDHESEKGDISVDNFFANFYDRPKDIPPHVWNKLPGVALSTRERLLLCLKRVKEGKTHNARPLWLACCGLKDAGSTEVFQLFEEAKVSDEEKQHWKKELGATMQQLDPKTFHYVQYREIAAAEKCEWPTKWCLEQVRQKPQSWVAGRYVDHLKFIIRHSQGEERDQALGQMIQLLAEENEDAWDFFAQFSKAPWKESQESQKLDDVMNKILWKRLEAGRLTLDNDKLPQFFAKHNFLGARFYCLNRLAQLRRTLSVEEVTAI